MSPIPNEAGSFRTVTGDSVGCSLSLTPQCEVSNIRACAGCARPQESPRLDRRSSRTHDTGISVLPGCARRVREPTPGTRAQYAAIRVSTRQFLPPALRSHDQDRPVGLCSSPRPRQVPVRLRDVKRRAGVMDAEQRVSHEHVRTRLRRASSRPSRSRCRQCVCSTHHAKPHRPHTERLRNPRDRVPEYHDESTRRGHAGDVRCNERSNRRDV